jgi:hypothetical protein
MAGGKIFVDELVTGTGLAVGDIEEKEATVSLTADQTKALFSAPQTVVAAPAAGYYLEYVSATLWYDYGDAAFGGIALGEDLQFRIDTVPVSATCETTGFLDQVADQVRHLNALCSADYVPAAATAMNLYLTAGDITNAGTTSILKLKILYRVRPATW